jgi:hypothetical protein
MEALQRYRGEQKVMVQQVSVSEGGQAIVGNVTQNQRATEQESTKEPPQVTRDTRPNMAVIDGKGERSPISIEAIKAQKAGSKK